MPTRTATAARPNAASLRILHVAEACESGVLYFVKTIANGQAEQGHAVRVVHGTRPRTPADMRPVFAAGVELERLSWGSRRLAGELRAALRLRALVKAWRPDVVHLHSSYAGLVGALALAGRGVPLVYTPNGYAFCMRDRPRLLRRAFAALERITAWRVDVVGCVSEAEAADARNVARAARVSVVQNGIPELDAAVPPAPAQRKPLVLVVGRIAPQKEPAACARIAAGVGDLARVVWVGSANADGGDLAALARSGVKVTGWLAREAVLAMLDEAAIVLHWSAWDGLSFAVLDAVARDAVVVASDIAPNREILGPLQVAASEREAIRIIRAALADRAYWLELRANQRARGGAFGAQRMIDGWLDVYEKTLAGARAQAPVARRDALEAV